MNRTHFAWLLLFPLAAVGCGGSEHAPASNRIATGSAARESARQIGFPETDLSNIRKSLTYISSTLVQLDRKPARLDDKAKQFLRDDKVLGLDDGELQELESVALTPLDASYLDLCFLNRDAARSLEIDDLPVPDRAARAFAWVCRQVRLIERTSTYPPTPPQYILRRGYGTSLERGLVFLALLDQLGCQGCLVTFAGKEREAHVVCGVLQEKAGKDVFLFDPALGAPLPGPDGRGIATLATIKKQKHLLEPFGVDEKYHYETSPTRIEGFCLLSALAPRMKVLQEELQKAGTTIQLARDAHVLLDQFKGVAAAAGGKELTVRLNHEAAAVLRTFLPVEDGGVDTNQGLDLGRLAGFAAAKDARTKVSMNRLRAFTLELTPWRYLPQSLRDLEWNAEVGQAPRLHFARLFAALAMEPGKPRDEILRGRLGPAASELVRLRELLPQQKEQALSNPELAVEVADWARAADQAWTDLLRAKNTNPGGVEAAQAELTRVMNEGQKKWPVLLEGVTADARRAEVTYLLALATHEKAERLREQQRRAGKNVEDQQGQEVRNAWQTAASWWDTFLSDYPGSPGAAVARGLHAECQEALGDTRTAIKQLEDLSGMLTDLEKAARLYQAKQRKATLRD